MGADASKPGDYEEPDLPDGQVEVRLSVYSLSFSSVSVLNSIGAAATGAYHSGLVVFNEEWAYGGHDEDGKTGVYRCTPEMNQDYQFSSRIVLGRLNATSKQVMEVIKSLASRPDWYGSKYDLIEHNCNHFASELCWALMRRRPPDWVNRTAETMARARRTSRVEKEALRLALASYRSRYGVTASKSSSADAPGARAFADTFSSTFELALKHHKELFRLRGPGAEEAEAGVSADEPPFADEVVDLRHLPKNAQDVVALRRQAEKEALTVVINAAKAAAHAVASAARQASAARASQPPESVAAWDAAWARESAPLLKAWREDAIAGDLLVDASEACAPGSPEAEAHATRDDQVKAALAVAAEEASRI
eukprot:TRINITY_DN51236_c0_g1_i1.p1 TRINITY_DN51236_c0_g1~~TRINITY_DN51236_c0_g1_i1.p1  ORF type:complete len:366 (-),score=76.55 TRINITY_DN51236_c0_g1_i1:101-1198(-)